MSWSIFIPYLAVMAISTYLIRAVPFVLINKKLENKFIKSFLYYVPYTVLAAMTFPAILYGTNHILTAAAGFVVAILIAYRGKGLLTVAVGASAAVFVTELLYLLLG